MTTEEIFDVTDENDNVIGQARRSEVHARGLLHRAVHIFVLNTAGLLLLQKRTAEKDEFPQCFTSSASGHVSAGETYDECAPRELEEELGLRVPIQRLEKFPAGPQTANEHSVLYHTVTDDEPTFDPVEIECGAYFTLDEIATMIEEQPDQFTPPFRVLFQWYVQHCGE
jgi:16S rRNA (adenine1518-N6/adenine1519-N6)-dimethyltransferase